MRKHLLRFCIGFIFLNPFSFVWSQGEATKWYFGIHAGLDFSTNPPTILTGALTNAEEGCASVADAAGNLLFYTNGEIVFNKLHQVMLNGTGLLGNISSSQSSLIVKKPGSVTGYYIFTTDHYGHPGGLCYSLVDMNLAGGLGAVTTLNTQLYTPTSERLTAIRHCNGTDVWIITHGTTNNTFKVFLVNATGVNSVPVISTVGPVLSYVIGCMKISPNGKKLAVGNSGGCDLYDFDNANGTVSNFIDVYSGVKSGYGCEFSPDGTKLYCSFMGNFNMEGEIFQWDLCAGSANAIIASQYPVSGFIENPLTIQMAPNGKMYIAKAEKTYISVINNPNQAGAACNFIDSAQSIAPNICRNGLPNFVCGTVKEPLVFSAVPGSNCLSLLFSAPATASQPVLNCTSPGVSVTGYHWFFGDPASGAANTSAMANPTHAYSAAGAYTVKLAINYSGCAADTIINTVLVAQTLITTNALPSCSAGATVTVPGATGNYTYLWNPGGYITQGITGVASGIYSVTVTDPVNNCVFNNTVQVTAAAVPTLNITGNFSICAGQACSLTVSGANTYSWSNGPVSSLNIVSPATTTSYSVTGKKLSSGCTNNSTVTVTVFKCTGLEEITQSDDLVKIYPNPNSGYIYLEPAMPGKVILYDLAGKVVLERKVEQGRQGLDISNLSNGIYMLKWFSNNTVKKYHILKNNDQQ